jgi:arylsulfatase A-like enzyme
VPHWNLREGFQRYEEVCGYRSGPLAESTVARAGGELDRLSGGDSPFFLWVHFYDAHDPYVDHPDLDWGRTSGERYDEELRYLDTHLVPFLERAIRGRGRPTFVFVTADHGEGFGEHGSAPHARTLYREVTRVPLLVFGPGVVPRRADDLVSSSDLYPTLLQLGGATIPAGTTMDSLASAFSGGELDRERSVFQENSWSIPRRHVKAVLRGRYHLIRDYTRDTVELYDLESDPEEKHNLAGHRPEVEAGLRRLVEAFARTTTTPEELR